MRYLPHTTEDIEDMLQAVGARELDDLFAAIPPACRRQTPLLLPPPLTEWELTSHLEELAAQGGGDWRVFLGAGSQEHHIPALVPYLAGRSEFLTSYTPYQPEMSQGTLQAVFEFQTLISRLVGLEVTNASMYDGATALAEAALMAMRIVRRVTLVVSSLIHPHWREVLATYLAPRRDVNLVVLPAAADGRTDLSSLDSMPASCAPAAMLIQSPNIFGVFENLPASAKAIHTAGGLLISSFTEPFALGLSKTPGSLGADIVCGEAQSLGLPQGFGGPTLGLMSCAREYMRQIPGRLVGRTTDLEGNQAFVLTLSTREQHIRRSKAVSNICSNAGHCALTAGIFMAAIGGDGFRKMARVNLDRAEYLKAGLIRAGFAPLFSAPTFNEFVLKAPAGFAAVHRRLCRKRILAGFPLASWYPDLPELKDAWLFGVTETRTKADIDALLREVT
ncbi:MAG: aminomethyl-transferring glycine dehydrogenase subunit GcvPA [Desulfovibrio sp.]|jgi:glycine dehydrogenase subunit 1|nr:aminomethyl-transferring glycine dehydrogenase subunit GcvPA [Desulfovibrio sp.]